MSRFIALCLAALGCQAQDLRQALDDLQALMKAPVLSVSNREERLSEAPATVIVLRRSDLEARGYTNLSQILDDLPGMQLAREYGDHTLKNYMRGYRNLHGDPFRILLDGRVTNDLWMNQHETILQCYPLSRIERIEVVYGPVSSVYGPNASMGIINIITESPTSGARRQVALQGGSRGIRALDAGISLGLGEALLSMAAKVSREQLDMETREGYEYTRSHYALDRRLWGGFLDNPSIGENLSETRTRALDLRVNHEDTELGMSVMELSSGYGNEYALDRALSRGRWLRQEKSAHLRQQWRFTPALQGSTTLLVRETGHLPGSLFVDAYAEEPTGRRLAGFSFWQTRNEAWSLLQALDWKVTDPLLVRIGYSFEELDLQKAYETSSGPYLPPDQIQAGTYPYPAPLVPTPQEQNRITMQNQGLFSQLLWRLDEGQQLHLGWRSDHSSIHGRGQTMRFGYTRTFGPWNLKALYGNAYSEPTARSMYGSWRAGGAAPNLRKETSRTGEISGGYTSASFGLQASLWQVRSQDIILASLPTALNLGSQRLLGLELQVQGLLHPRWARLIRTWGSASFLLHNQGSNWPNLQGVVPLDGITGKGEVGDVARRQAFVGLSIEGYGSLDATLLGRYVGERPTVATNPLGRVNPYATWDLVVSARNLGGARGVDLRIKASNLLNRLYFHPGVAQADAGNTPGRWISPGVWSGSSGYYSSLLAQPGRSLTLTLSLRR